MKKYHLRYLGIPLLISILTITGLMTSGNLISETKFEVKNLNQTKNSVALTKVLEYDTVETYNNKIPTGVTITRKKGHTGLAYVDENNNETDTELGTIWDFEYQIPITVHVCQYFGEELNIYTEN